MDDKDPILFKILELGLTSIASSKLDPSRWNPLEISILVKFVPDDNEFDLYIWYFKFWDEFIFSWWLADSNKLLCNVLDPTTIIWTIRIKKIINDTVLLINRRSST